MSSIPLRTVAVAVCCGVAASVLVRGPSTGSVAPHSTAPVSLAVPASPVPVRAAGRVTLVYELHVTDTGSRAMKLERLDVRDADAPNAPPIATVARSELERDTKLIAPRGAPPPKALTPGVRAVIYIWIALDSSAAVPRALTHHVAFSDGSTVDGAPLIVRPAADLVLASPVGVGSSTSKPPPIRSNRRTSRIRSAKRASSRVSAVRGCGRSMSTMPTMRPGRADMTTTRVERKTASAIE